MRIIELKMYQNIRLTNYNCEIKKKENYQYDCLLLNK